MERYHPRLRSSQSREAHVCGVHHAPPTAAPTAALLPFYGERRLQRVRVCLQFKRLEVPVQRSSGNPEGGSQAALYGAVVQRDFTEARTQFFDGNALPAGFALATAFQLLVGNPCLTLLLVLLPQSLNRLPFAAGLNRGGLIRSSLQNPVVASGKDIPNHLFSL